MTTTPYSVNPGGLCITVCRKNPDIKVGSAGCMKCKSFRTRDVARKIVMCVDSK